MWFLHSFLTKFLIISLYSYSLIFIFSLNYFGCLLWLISTIEIYCINKKIINNCNNCFCYLALSLYKINLNFFFKKISSSVEDSCFSPSQIFFINFVDRQGMLKFYSESYLISNCIRNNKWINFITLETCAIYSSLIYILSFLI